MRTLLTGLLAIVTLVAAAPAKAATTIQMPALTGQYPVGTTDLHLVDSGRQDPWRPDNKRELMVTVSYPALRGGQRAPLLGPAVATAVNAELLLTPGAVDWRSVRRHAATGAPVAPGRWPVLLVSHGFGSVREMHAGLVDDLASHGYIVVSISHTFEAAAVEFPGDRVAHSVVGSWANTRKAIDTRVADTRFVLSQLRLPGADLDHVGMVGHSYGGFTAGETMLQDQRIDAGVNLDGAMPGDVTKGLDRPFLLVGSQGHSHLATEQDPSWAQFWSNQRGWKRDLNLGRGAHYGFTDLQFALPQMDFLTPAQRAPYIGTIDPAGSLAVQHDYLAAYFDLHLKGIDRHLFDGDSPSYPDARFVP
ncbi:lipase [Lentzea sp. NBRC 105346]|uniref:alpha/beta hydrolase family protein n=1 Tax=Lentzea sp. NBRC 105346 TaxID=3032205 RepID=UPI0024A1B506|nr:lipase [Lentzea sp. NBRC 105346]GLZ35938.1 lipase [Lentzea sp. NBRC 105346]